jgi:hypothetical protein
MNLMDGGGDEEYCCQFEGHEGWGPCRHDVEREQAARHEGERETDSFVIATYFHANCRYSGLRAFHTEIEAASNACTIKNQVEYNGGTYVPLHPFLCPDVGGEDKPDHYHLSRS